ncbi:hypothetical protein EZ428_12300 [Pedobacter frigiditerrae]|uniref:Uncharacterized protein n=1 Tax=Pedobacter frigiditerrae TaxID=2530452 RepID=A0A4R0MVW6_9SPHI|nr:hypothetical protein [Pedobacter frigiditerrae]TCC90064.1 hypothetical protein EZ428_12300 [Pedobacter frigiditerrae]
MKDLTFNSNETKFLDGIQEFFGTRTVINHLTFIDKWMELLLGGKPSKRWTKPADLYYFYERIEALFEVSYQLNKATEGYVSLAASATLDQAFLETEQYALTYFPYQLKEQHLLNPLKAIKAIFKKQDLQYYKQTLREWVAEGLNDNYATENADYIIPLYTNAKKLIAACWLFHERVVTKNSFKKPSYPNPLLNFALTEPRLFTEEEVKSPYLMIEEFFNFTNLSGYREELQDWFMSVINEDIAAKKPNDCLFIHNQYTQLVQAGYIIVAQKLPYVPKPDKHDGRTMGQWMLDKRDSDISEGEIMLGDEEPHVLSLAERAAPMEYCTEALSHDKVVKLRFGLQEWLDAGLSENSSIHGIGDEYAFSFYLTLQKLTEAFYLIITENAKTPVLPLTIASHEA